MKHGIVSFDVPTLYDQGYKQFVLALLGEQSFSIMTAAALIYIEDTWAKCSPTSNTALPE